jgi:hypothetical protein
MNLSQGASGYRNNIRKTYKEEQYPSRVNAHQMPDHPSSCIAIWMILGLTAFNYVKNSFSATCLHIRQKNEFSKRN